MVSIPIRRESGPSPHAASYRATPGSRFKDADAEVIGAIVTEIIVEKGGIKPADVVAAATPEDSPLHRYFTWDDALAAGHYRLNQARGLLRAVQVQIEYRTPDGNKGRAWTRGFQSVRVPGPGEPQDGQNPPTQRVYVPIRYAQAQPQLMAQIVQDAAKYLWAWHAKYRQYGAIGEFAATFGPIFAALDDMANPYLLDEEEIEDTDEDESPVLNQDDDSEAVNEDETEPPASLGE